MTLQGITLVAITALEKHLLSGLNIKSCNSQCSVKCRSLALGHGACLNNYYAMFQTHSYHCYREAHFISRLEVEF